MTRMLRLLTTTALLSLAILAEASPAQNRSISTDTSLSTSTYSEIATTASSSPTSVATSIATPSSSQTTFITDEVPFLTRDASSASSSSRPLITFCESFVKQCYTIALEGQEGEVEVTHSCQRNGGKYSSSYTYSCARNGQRLTPAVLKALGWTFFRASTTTVTEDDKLITNTIRETSTVLDTTTTKVTTLTNATVTSTTWTDVVNVEVETVPSTVSSTTVIPYTVSSTTTATITQLTTTTSSVISTQTQVFISTGLIPVARAVVPSADDNQEVQKRAPSTFCLAFRVACHDECGKSFSRVDVEICDSSSSPMYTLACICKNGKRQTQHALEAIAEDRRIVSVTASAGTSTTYVTYLTTLTVPTEALRTVFETSNSLVQRTSTLLTTSTATMGETTTYTGISSTVQTDVATIRTTSTIATTTNTQVVTTTKLVLAATGFVHAFDNTTGEDVGTLIRGADSLPFRPIEIMRSTNGQREPEKFMAIRSNPTGLYQLAVFGNPGRVVTTKSALNQIVKQGSDYWSFAQYVYAADCGTPGSAPGPIDPQALVTCETYIFSPVALDSRPGATTDTVNLKPYWINPTGSVPANFSGLWACTNDEYRKLLQVADRSAYMRSNPSAKLLWLNLRFPFPT